MIPRAVPRPARRVSLPDAPARDDLPLQRDADSIADPGDW